MTINCHAILGTIPTTNYQYYQCHYHESEYSCMTDGDTFSCFIFCFVVKIAPSESEIAALRSMAGQMPVKEVKQLETIFTYYLHYLLPSKCQSAAA